MQPDAAAGNTDDKKRPDFWHLGLASAKLLPHKWPRVPLQIRQRAEKKGPRGMSSMQPGGGCVTCPKLPSLMGFPFQPYQSSGVPGFTLLLV